MVRVQVPEWLSERLAIEYQVSGINVDFANKPNSGSLWRKSDHASAAVQDNTHIILQSCLYHKINEIWRQKNL